MDSKTLKSIRNFILLILIAWFVKTTILEIYVVPTGSMFDTIEQNDLVIGNKFIYGLRTPNWIGIPFSRIGNYIPNYRFPEFKEVKNGDITVFEFPYDDMHKYVKRTIGLPKQYIQIREGEISIGDSENSIKYKETLTYPEKSRIKKEKDSVFVSRRPTEKSFNSFLINKFPELFSYYKSVEIEAPNDKYDEGEIFIDGNGIYDEGEEFVDAKNDKWDEGEDFIDIGNGEWDRGEGFKDENNNGHRDQGEKFKDIGDGKWSEAEQFDDSNSNGKWDQSEAFSDSNNNGKWDSAEIFVDSFNGVYDEGEEFVDAKNGKWDEGEIFIDGKEYIDRDNIRFQVPFKGMTLDLNNDSSDLYSSLMILLLDGYDISLKDYSIEDLGSIYNYDSSNIGYEKVESDKNYQFHKLDNEQVFDTSMTIWGFISGIPLPIILLIISLIIWKLYSLVKEAFKLKDYNKKNFKISHVLQFVLYCSLMSFIIYLLTIDISAMRKERPQHLMNSVNNDLQDNKISLKDFFQYKLIKERDAFSQKIDDELNLEHDLYKEYFNLSLNELIKQDSGLAGLMRRNNLQSIDCESIYNLNFNKQSLESDIKGAQILNFIFEDKQVSIDLKYSIMQILVDYYNYKNIYDYNVNFQINKKIRQDLFDNILINGVSLSEKSDYVLRHNYYFMVGDNRNGSSDSRSWGFVPDYNLLGQPVITLANFGKFRLKFDVHL